MKPKAVSTHNPADWRDPAMPVLRSYLMPNGERRLTVDPDYERRYREHIMNTAPMPDWWNDPTYNLSRRKQPR